MSFIADVSLEMPLMAPTHEAVPEAEGTLADYHRMGDESGSSRYVLFVWFTDCDFEALERAIETDDTVESYRAVVDAGDRQLYRVRSTPVDEEAFHLTVFLRDHGIALQEVTRDRDGLHLRAQFPSRDSLHALLDALDRSEMASRLDGVYSQDPQGAVHQGLTERQWEVLRVAAGKGYFETPSEVTLEEIGSEFDISPQAVSTHLRAAVKKLVDDALEARGSRPVVA